MKTPGFSHGKSTAGDRKPAKTSLSERQSHPKTVIKRENCPRGHLKGGLRPSRLGSGSRRAASRPADDFRIIGFGCLVPVRDTADRPAFLAPLPVLVLELLKDRGVSRRSLRLLVSHREVVIHLPKDPDSRRSVFRVGAGLRAVPAHGVSGGGSEKPESERRNDWFSSWLNVLYEFIFRKILFNQIKSCFFLN